MKHYIYILLTLLLISCKTSKTATKEVSQLEQKADSSATKIFEDEEITVQWWFSNDSVLEQTFFPTILNDSMPKPNVAGTSKTGFIKVTKRKNTDIQETKNEETTSYLRENEIKNSEEVLKQPQVNIVNSLIYAIIIAILVKIMYVNRKKIRNFLFSQK